MTKPPTRTRSTASDGLGEALLSLRKLKGLTQDEAADLAGVHSVTYQRYERGERKITLAHAEEIAQALGFTPDELMEAIQTARGRPSRPMLGGHGFAGMAEREPASYVVDIGARARAGSRAPMAYQTSPDAEQVDLSWMFGGSAGFLRAAGDSGTGYVESGQVVVFDRNRWPAKGDGCVIETDSGEFYIKEYVRQEDDQIVVRQRFPEAELTFKLSELKGVYKIRGRLD